MTAWAHLPNAALIDEVLASVRVNPKEWDAARAAAGSAVAVLVAHDDAGQFMKLPVEHLRRLHRIEPHPMFLLLQPAAIVFSPQATS